MLLLPACLLALACLPAVASARTPDAAGRRCQQPAHFYEERRYVVRKIRVSTVADLFGVGKKQLAAELAAAQAALRPEGQGLTEGQEFKNITGYFALQTTLAERLQTIRPGERFKFAYVTSYLDACDDDASPPTLEVVYRVFSTEPLSYVTSIAETRFDKITRALVPQKLLGGVSEAFPEPLVGYDRSRGLFAGAHVAETFEGPLFNKFDAEVTGSGGSAEAGAGLSGTGDFEGPVSHLEWRLGYRYSDIPSDDVRLREATGLGHLFGATRPFGPGVVLRFGGSVEGGHRQSDLPQAAVPTGDPADASHGAAKLYLGGTLNRGRRAGSASYGLQLGQSRRGWQLDYVKQVFDTNYNVRLLAREHRPFSADLKVGAGWIQAGRGGVPVAERFFGGNRPEDFIQGDTWRINSSPLIRSFPQNRLNRTGLGAPIGGENFFSANLTLAQTVWGRPAIPAEVRRDADFNVQFGAAILGLRNTIVGDEVLRSAPYLSAQEKLRKKYAPLLSGLKAALDAIPTAGLPEDDADFLQRTKDDVDAAREAAEKGQVKQLLLGFPPVADSLLQTVRDDIEQLKTSLPTQAPALDAASAGFDDAAAEEVLTDYRAAQAQAFVATEAFGPLLARLPELEAVLARVRERAARLPSAAPPADACPDYADALSAVRTYTEAALDDLESARQDATKTDGFAKTGFEKLFKGQGPLFPPRLASVVAAVRGLNRELACAGRGSDAAPLTADAELIARLLPELSAEYGRLPTPQLESKANRELAYTGRVLDIIFRELNTISLSPVFMLDAARIGPQTAAGGGFRYGVGGGLRLSVVTLDITAGYSVNPNRRPGEGRGAFVFSLDVTDLFR
jgi:hypothetical protein